MDQIEKIEVAAQTNNTATAWKIVNTMTNRKTTPTGKFKDKSPEERKTQWLEHFKSLLGSSDNAPPFGEIDPILTHTQIADSAFTLNKGIYSGHQT